MQAPDATGEKPAPEPNPYASPPWPQAAAPPETWLPSGPAALRSGRRWQAIIRRRIRKYESPHAVRQDAVGQGLPAPEADRYVDTELRAFRRGAVATIIVGALMAILCLGVIVTSHAAATAGPRGAPLAILAVPMVFGVVVALVGFVRLLRILGGEAGQADVAAAHYFRLEASSLPTMINRFRARQKERDLDVKLPDPGEARPLAGEPAPLFVDVTRDGRYLVAGKALDSEKLGEVFKAAQANHPHQRVVIRADEDVAMRRIATVMDLCARYGPTLRLSMVTRRPKDGPSGDTAPTRKRP